MSAATDPVAGLPLLECDLDLAGAAPVVHNELLLSGWAASAKGVSGVAVQIGERQWTAAYGLDTPALAERLPWAEAADRAGYRLAIDTSRWQPGSYVVTVAAFDRQGGRSAVEGPVEIRPFPPESGVGRDGAQPAGSGSLELRLDEPAVAEGRAEVEGALDVRGWAHAAEGVEAVLVTLDGTLQYEALRPLARPDLIRELGQEAALDAGFQLRLDPVDCPPGRHRLVVTALGHDGRTAGVEVDLVCRPASMGLSAGLPTEVVAAPSGPPSVRRADREPTDAERMWESRALLAESEAALCRAEARLARAGEERARRELRELLDGRRS